MKWFKQLKSSDFDYLPVLTELEEDDRGSQLMLESENLLLNQSILSQARQETERRSRTRSASIRRIQTENKPSTGGFTDLPDHDPQDPPVQRLQRLEFENQQMNEMILQQAQGQPYLHLVPLCSDNTAQNLLGSMRQHSDRLRCTRAHQQPADTHSSDVQSLRDELANLRRENEIYRSLVCQTPQSPQLTNNAEAQRLRCAVVNLRWENERLRTHLVASYLPPLEFAPPPPYARAD